MSQEKKKCSGFPTIVDPIGLCNDQSRFVIQIKEAEAIIQRNSDT